MRVERTCHGRGGTAECDPFRHLTGIACCSANVASALLPCARPVVPQWALNSNAYEINLVCKGLPYCDIGSEAALEFLGARRRRLVAERAK